MPAKISAMSKIQKIHRIYTEDIRRRSVIRAVGKVFDNFTLQPTTGFYKGRRGVYCYRNYWCRRRSDQIVGRADSRD